jgi:hypothetical protein
MITVIGVRTDPTIRYFCANAVALGSSVQFIDLAELVTGSWQLTLPHSDASWVNTTDCLQGARLHLDPCGGYYCRLIDLGCVCPTQAVVWRTIIGAFSGWLELCAGIVVNRPGHANDNACKPFHEARLSRMGFAVPESYTGSRKSDLAAFAAAGKTIAKALSGQRADCRIVTQADFEDYEDRSGPVHLQRYVPGDDIRAHVIGNEIVSIRIVSSTPDYRIASDVRFEDCELPISLADELRSATRTFGLAFAGWDLKLDRQDYWVLEVNPMPGYNYYDAKLDKRITRALLAHLNGES